MPILLAGLEHPYSRLEGLNCVTISSFQYHVDSLIVYRNEQKFVPSCQEVVTDHHSFCFGNKTTNDLGNFSREGSFWIVVLDDVVNNGLPSVVNKKKVLWQG